MSFDFVDAETALRSGARAYCGWTFERFLGEAPREPVPVRSDSGRAYLLDVSVLDRSGDYDPKDERLEIELSVFERTAEGRSESLGAEWSLARGETFSGEVGEVYPIRSLSRSERRGVFAFACFAAVLAALLIWFFAR